MNIKMSKKILTIKNIVIGIGLIILDLTVYIILGLLLMNYDDFYDESKGEYWSLGSMTASQKATYIALNIWHIVNIAIIVYLIYSIIKTVRHNALQ